MRALTSEELNQYPSDYRVWIIIDKNDATHTLLFPMNLELEKHLGVFAFTEEADVTHMVRLLKKHAKNFKYKDLEISHDLLRDLGEGSAEDQIPLVVVNEENAMDFFTRYVDDLDSYYGY